MEKRQDTDRPQTDRMIELSQALVASPRAANEETDAGIANAEDTSDQDVLAADVAADVETDVEASAEAVVGDLAANIVEASVVEASVVEASVVEASVMETSTEALEEDLVAAAEDDEADDAELALAAELETSAPIEEDESVEVEAVEDESLDPQQRIGRSLQDKRNALDMGLEDIARTTKIPKTSLEHIEAGRFDSLPGDVFARGFLRSYARCVGMDGDEVVRRYAQCGLNPAPVSSALADAVLVGRRKPTHGKAGHGKAVQSKSSQGSAAQGNAAQGNAAHGKAAHGKSSEEKFARANSNAPSDRKASERHDRASTKQSSQSKETASRASSVLDRDVETGSADGNAVRKVLRDAFDLGQQVRSGLSRSASKRNPKSAPEIVNAEAPAAECKSVRERKTRTFVPPSFDYENDMTHRGPLTLGVIILVIVATLTMSYLLRRPGTSTDGFTMNSPSMLEMQNEAASASVSPSTPNHRAERV